MTDSAHPFASPGAVAPRKRPPWMFPVDMARGFLIGMAELVPGVSGGTVALVTGVYDELINSADHIVNAGKTLVTGPDRLSGALRELRRTQWLLILPVIIGMAAAVLGMAGVMSSFVTDHPELSKGLFLGLVAASIIVPIRMLPARRLSGPGSRAEHPVIETIAFIAAIIIAVVLTSFAGGQTVQDPALPLVAAAAAVAICALVVPGISGSFFLLTVGLYVPTMQAVDDRNLAYLGVFALGALVGLASFVKLLNYLLSTHRRITLIVMTGLMIGSLRALWPWQSAGAEEGKGSGGLLAPYDPVLGTILLAALGAAAVIVLVIVESRMLKKHPGH